ncbi:sphingomyelin phosphodiesterase [Undibacterium sp.]|uniref:sphingomyelin phosphodiesterase n=1 Tax=Undibacterium sp. TaxID=1914977 RepID=UPI0025E1CA49|nr:sphingomyelin phosphodiesterase [Undibacterium sp.]
MKKILCTLVLAMTAAQAYAAYPEDLKLSSWNTMLLPLSAFPNFGQLQRAQLIAQAPSLEQQEVVAFQELFDNRASVELLASMKSRFPYQTPVIGRAKTGWDKTEGTWRDAVPEDGGVAIVSKWPIAEKIQYLFKAAGCGDDFPSLKGFAYAKIDRKGEFYHVISTHLQSESSWGCSANGGHAAIRQAQLAEIRSWIDRKGIPNSEMVVITGDFNINRWNTAEYRAMLATLNVQEPRYVGVPHTFDTVSNGVALERYGARTGDPQEYLDYILVDRSHRQPTVWHNLAIDPPSPQWKVQDATSKRSYTYTDYSDHYPVQAFARADTSTPTHSYVDQAGSYRQVGLQNVGNGRWLQSAADAQGWLKTDAAQFGAPRTRFNLSNNFSMRDNGCLRSGEYLRIERSDLANTFLTWSGALTANQYSYYSSPGSLQADPELRLINVSNPQGCLKEGDLVAFKSWARAADYYLSAWPDGSYKDRLYVWTSSLGLYEQFRVHLPLKPGNLDWRMQLAY